MIKHGNHVPVLGGENMVPAPRTRYTSGSDWAAVLHEDRTESRHADSPQGATSPVRGQSVPRQAFLPTQGRTSAH